jgi:salicylate hydroxylase
MADKHPVLIAGAGIGGLALALALAQGGFEVSVIERSPALQEVGAGLQLSPNASRILDALGLGPALDRAGTRPDAVRVLDGRSGKSIVSLQLGRSAEARWGAPYRVIHRADLQRVLVEAVLAEGVTVELGTELVDFAETDAGVLTHLRSLDGDETRTSTVLVGADGLNSAVRARLGGSVPKFSGQIAWRATLPMDSRNETGLWLGPGGHLVSYPLNSGNLMNLVAVTTGAAGGDEWASPASGEELARVFGAWAKPAQALILAARPWTRWPLYDLEPSSVWGTGRVTILGDAAHAMLPHLAQGAAMAIEDAAALASSFSQLPEAPQAALRRYEAARQPRTAAAWAGARKNGRIYRLSGPAAFARDNAFRLLGGERILGRLDWLYSYRGA